MSKRDPMDKGYNIALHGIRNKKGSAEVAIEIMKKGLVLAPGANSIRSTTVQLGDQYRNVFFNEDLEYYLKNYRFGIESEGYNVIVKTPTVIKNSKGDALYLGDPYTGIHDKDFASGGLQYETTSILDIACANMEKIPPEFIYGYTKPNPSNDEVEIIKNENFYQQLLKNNPEKMDELFDVIKDCLRTTCYRY